MSIYLHDWSASGEAGMLEDFGIDTSALDGAEVLVASYTYENYSGDAFVLFKRDGKLFEVNGGHCSCYGLSESSYCGDATTQWQPEEVSSEALRHRLTGTSYGEVDKIREAIMAALDAFDSGAA